jgi:hypothetical protein
VPLSSEAKKKRDLKVQQRNLTADTPPPNLASSIPPDPMDDPQLAALVNKVIAEGQDPEDPANIGLEDMANELIQTGNINEIPKLAQLAQGITSRKAAMQKVSDTLKSATGDVNGAPQAAQGQMDVPTEQVIAENLVGQSQDNLEARLSRLQQLMPEVDIPAAINSDEAVGNLESLLQLADEKITAQADLHAQRIDEILGERSNIPNTIRIIGMLGAAISPGIGAAILGAGNIMQSQQQRDINARLGAERDLLGERTDAIDTFVETGAQALMSDFLQKNQQRFEFQKTIIGQAQQNVQMLFSQMGRMEELGLKSELTRQEQTELVQLQAQAQKSLEEIAFSNKKDLFLGESSLKLSLQERQIQSELLLQTMNIRMQGTSEDKQIEANKKLQEIKNRHDLEISRLETASRERIAGIDEESLADKRAISETAMLAWAESFDEDSIEEMTMADLQIAAILEGHRLGVELEGFVDEAMIENTIRVVMRKHPDILKSSIREGDTIDPALELLGVDEVNKTKREVDAEALDPLGPNFIFNEINDMRLRAIFKKETGKSFSDPSFQAWKKTYLNEQVKKSVPGIFRSR